MRCWNGWDDGLNDESGGFPIRKPPLF